MDRFKQIETFVTVAARGSLSAAAQAEGVAPAIIGRRIDALEERLGVKLLVRTTRRITLTYEGSAFLEDCQRIIHDMQNAEASVHVFGWKITLPDGSAVIGIAVIMLLALLLRPSGITGGREFALPRRLRQGAPAPEPPAAAQEGV